MGYRIIDGKAYPVGKIGDFQSLPQVRKNNNSNNDFKNILDKTIEDKNSFTISKHASQRLNEINFSEVDMQNIQKGFELAEDKGSKNSLMLYKDVAIIASIENRTVITAVEKSRAEENVFTNIDSVVLL